MSRRPRLAPSLFLLLVALLASRVEPSHGQPSSRAAQTTPRRIGQAAGERVTGTYYRPDHLYWNAAGPDNVRERKSLLPLLSSTQAVVGFTWATATVGDEATKRARLREFLRRPPTGLPTIANAAECDLGPTFAAFLLTLGDQGGPGRILSFLNALHAQAIFDFVAPVFFLPEKLAYPFPRFEVEFRPTALIGDGEAAIRRFNAANGVAVVSIAENVYTLALRRETPTNVLATVLTYLDTPWLVKHARLTWRGVFRPLTASAELRTPLNVALVDVRDPVEYVVTIDRDRDVTVIPEMTSESEVKGWMIKALDVPEEVVDLKEIRRTTEPLGPSRERDRIAFVFLFSKTGMYELPALEVRYTSGDLLGARKIERLVAGGPFRLTVDEHLPKYVPGVPGTPFVVSGTALRASRATAVAAGGLLLAGGALLVAVALSGAMTWRARRARAHPRAEAQLPAETYRTFWNKTELAAATLRLGDPSAEKSWLRDVGRAVRRLLGARVCGDEAAFLGGAGTSAADIREVARADSSIEEALAALEDLDGLCDVADPGLSREQRDHLRRRVSRLMTATPP